MGVGGCMQPLRWDTWDTWDTFLLSLSRRIDRDPGGYPKSVPSVPSVPTGRLHALAHTHGKLVRLDIAERDAEIPLHAAFLGLKPTFAHGLTECGEGQHELVPLLGFLSRRSS